MIVVRLCGGLGNQMFQYALGRVLAIKNKATLKFDLSAYHCVAPGDTPRNYRLNFFQIKGQPLNTLTAMSLLPFPRHIPQRLAWVPHWPGLVKKRVEHGLAFDAAVLEARGSLYLDGYWQTEKYFADFADQIRSDFQLRAPLTPSRQKLAAQMAGVSSVSVHVRRGDYVTNPNASAFHGTCSPQWYNEVITQMTASITAPQFFVFSDDPAWARANLSVPQESIFVDPQPDGRDYEDIFLMSRCSHHIIANSSFSWWGAWLNPSPAKKVIAPSRWFIAETDMRDRIPQSWTQV